MDILRNKKTDNKEARLQEFLAHEEKKPQYAYGPQAELDRKIPTGALIHWQAPEFEMYDRDKKWYLYMALVWVALIAYAVWTNSPIMAITFILIGIIEYVHLEQEPKILDFTITNDGVIAGREIYEFESLQSFWIFYEPPHLKIISLRTKGKLIPIVHIPVENEDPTEIRRLLMKFIPEIKQEPSFVDTLERLFRL